VFFINSVTEPRMPLPSLSSSQIAPGQSLTVNGGAPSY
jgi:hypothetical protein